VAPRCPPQSVSPPPQRGGTTTPPRTLNIRRFSSRREPLDHSFLRERLRNARSYDRIAGYFCSSLLEVVGEELEAVAGTIRMVCNSDLDPADVQTARAAQTAVRRAWCAFEPEKLLDRAGGERVRQRYARLFKILKSGKLQVRVLPDAAFGLVHGKAGVITMRDGAQTCFMGSANESKSAWRMNYELVWEDTSPEAIAWVQEEFDVLWGSPAAVPWRISSWKTLVGWRSEGLCEASPSGQARRGNRSTQRRR
jgi:hypothetical protein